MMKRKTSLEAVVSCRPSRMPALRFDIGCGAVYSSENVKKGEQDRRTVSVTLAMVPPAKDPATAKK